MGDERDNINDLLIKGLESATATEHIFLYGDSAVPTDSDELAGILSGNLDNFITRAYPAQISAVEAVIDENGNQIYQVKLGFFTRASDNLGHEISVTRQVTLQSADLQRIQNISADEVKAIIANPTESHSGLIISKSNTEVFDAKEPITRLRQIDDLNYYSYLPFIPQTATSPQNPPAPSRQELYEIFHGIIRESLPELLDEVMTILSEIGVQSLWLQGFNIREYLNNSYNDTHGLLVASMIKNEINGLSQYPGNFSGLLDSLTSNPNLSGIKASTHAYGETLSPYFFDPFDPLARQLAILIREKIPEQLVMFSNIANQGYFLDSTGVDSEKSGQGGDYRNTSGNSVVINGVCISDETSLPVSTFPKETIDYMTMFAMPYRQNPIIDILKDKEGKPILDDTGKPQLIYGLGGGTSLGAPLLALIYTSFYSEAVRLGYPNPKDLTMLAMMLSASQIAGDVAAGDVRNMVSGMHVFSNGSFGMAPDPEIMKSIFRELAAIPELQLTNYTTTTQPPVYLSNTLNPSSFEKIDWPPGSSSPGKAVVANFDFSHLNNAVISHIAFDFAVGLYDEKLKTRKQLPADVEIYLVPPEEVWGDKTENWLLLRRAEPPSQENTYITRGTDPDGTLSTPLLNLTPAQGTWKVVFYSPNNPDALDGLPIEAEMRIKTGTYIQLLKDFHTFTAANPGASTKDFFMARYPATMGTQPYFENNPVMQAIRATQSYVPSRDCSIKDSSAAAGLVDGNYDYDEIIPMPIQRPEYRQELTPGVSGR